jgi:hypothetical protein
VRRDWLLEASGIPANGLIRNHYVGRTFIGTAAVDSSFWCQGRAEPVRSILDGRRGWRDDSIVRDDEPEDREWCAMRRTKPTCISVADGVAVFMV